MIVVIRRAEPAAVFSFKDIRSLVVKFNSALCPVTDLCGTARGGHYVFFLCLPCLASPTERGGGQEWGGGGGVDHTTLVSTP